MNRFEYTITLHPAETFRKVAFFCTREGECTLDDLPMDEIETLKGILNDRGEQGWELVSIAFGRNGLFAVWKRERVPVK